MREQRDARGFSGLMRWNEISTVNEVLSIRSADESCVRPTRTLYLRNA